MEAYSVAMSVYRDVVPAYFEAAVDSMLGQSVPPDDFVIVCDGPLTPELDAVLERCVQQCPRLFHIIRLPENVGIGAAANVALKACKNDLVAKMDADDIAVPDRCERQLCCFREDPALGICGGQIEEFREDPRQPFAVRRVPRTDAQIRRFARRRQPFNNMTVMYRRSGVLTAGGYRPLRRCEDYDLYLRLLDSGCRAGNLPQVLVRVRVDDRAMHRRGSFATVSACVRMRWEAYRRGSISLADLICCCTGAWIIWIVPIGLRRWIYRHFLRTEIQ